MTRQEIGEKIDELAREDYDTHNPEIPEEVNELARRLGESIESANQKVNAKLTSSCLRTPPTSDIAFGSASRRILDISHLSAAAQAFSLPCTPLLASESKFVQKYQRVLAIARRYRAFMIMPKTYHN